MNAFKVHQYWMIYRQFLEENNINDDSDEITVDSLIHYVDTEIDEEEFEEIRERVNEIYGLV